MQPGSPASSPLNQLHDPKRGYIFCVASFATGILKPGDATPQLYIYIYHIGIRKVQVTCSFMMSALSPQMEQQLPGATREDSPFTTTKVSLSGSCRAKKVNKVKKGRPPRGFCWMRWGSPKKDLANLEGRESVQK